MCILFINISVLGCAQQKSKTCWVELWSKSGLWLSAKGSTKGQV